MSEKDIIPSKAKSKRIRNLYDFLRVSFPTMTLRQGCAVWWLLENTEVIVGRRDISGTWRYNASVIAELTNRGDYVTYYYSVPVENHKILPKPEFRFTKRYANQLAKRILLNPFLKKIVIDLEFEHASVWDDMKNAKVEFRSL